MRSRHRRRKPRKPREAPPPAPYLVSLHGHVGARLKKTSRTRDGMWLYRLDYGNVVGTQEWTLPELERIAKWRKNPPHDYRLADSERTKRRQQTADE